jgi:hypothetical protein
MPMAGPADDAAIREQAYYFWEQDGRPSGRETEYWMRAVVAVTGKSQLETLAKPAPKTAAKPKAEVKPKAAAKSKAEVKPRAVAKPAAKPALKAAASKTKAAPAKAEPAKKPKKK